MASSGGNTGAVAESSGGSAAAGAAGMRSSGGVAGGGSTEGGASSSTGASSSAGVNSGGGGHGNVAGQSGSAGSGQGADAAGAGQAGAGGSLDAGGSGGAAGSAGVAEAGRGGEGGAGERCPNASAPTQGVELEIPALSEASGLCASRLSPGVFFTHNDSGTSSELYAFAADGAFVATLVFSGALSEDWEDIATGPGPESGKKYIYVADIGDNDRIRTTSIVVERALEPVLAASERGRTLQLPFQSLYFSYPDEPHNAETLLVDPNTGDFYIATKGDTDGTRIYLARAPHSTTAITPLEYVTTLSLDAAPAGAEPLATGGSVAPDGSALLIRTYDAVFSWARAPGTSLGQALRGAACLLPVADEAQGEGVTFGDDAFSYYTLGEGTAPKLSRVVLSR